MTFSLTSRIATVQTPILMAYSLLFFVSNILKITIYGSEEAFIYV